MAERVRSIIITGGASGIGLGIAEHFASSKENNHITLLDINPRSGSQALDSLRSKYPGASLSFEACDVSSWESQAEAFEKVARERGGVDVVFANAGITESGKFIRDAIESGDGKPVKPALKTVDVNFLGVVYCMFILTLWSKPTVVLTWKAVYLAVHFISKNASTNRNGTQSKGSIVCTSSNAGLYAFPIAPIYAATKAGIVGLVRGLAQGLAVESIQINALAPAVIGEALLQHNLLLSY